MDNCTVWQEGKWIGPAAPVYCTAERDVAERRVLPGQFIRYFSLVSRSSVLIIALTGIVGAGVMTHNEEFSR